MKDQDKTMLQVIQDDYLNLLLEYDWIFTDKEAAATNIIGLLDEIKMFWLKRLDTVNYELKHLTDKYSTFLLSGTVYLNIENYEHYYFKALGNHHIVNDPLLKLDVFFRNEKGIKAQETINYFSKIYEDTVRVLKEYPYSFHFLPITQLACEDKDERNTLLDEFYWRFISDIFQNEFRNSQEFLDRYTKFDEIEKDLSSSIMENLIFTDVDDSKLSLEQRAEKYRQNNNMVIITQQISEAQLFIFMTYSHISQILDILMTCISMELIPFIRSDVPFRYLVLIMDTFLDESKIKTMLEKTIVFYIFYKTVDQDYFQKSNFLQYCGKLQKIDLLNIILEKLKESDIDIFVGGIKSAEKIIQENFVGALMSDK